MADSDKNIVITPNISSSSDNPKIVFSGADAATAAQDITLYTYPTSNGTLSFEGSAGQLFSITNDLTGTIFSVNDVSGIPSIEVDADGTIRLAEFGGNVLLGTATDDGTNLLQVDGSIVATAFSGPLSGNATTATTLQTSRTIALGGVLSGSASFDGSSNITITAAHTSDPVITLTGAVTGTGTMTNLGNVSIATTATSDPIITLTGAVTGSGTMTNLGNVSITTTNTADPTLTLAGDATGSATFTNLGNATLTVTVADDSHNHIISNVDGLQGALDAKLNLSGGTLTGALSGTTGAFSTSLSLGSEVVLAESTDRADLLQISSTTSTWGGLQIRNSISEGRWSFMTDGEVAGIYNDEDEQWHIYMTEVGSTQLRYAGSVKIETTNTGVAITGTATATTFSGALSGNATTATTLATARTINGVSFNGSANITVTANTPNTLTRGTYLTGSNFNGSAATTWAVDATTAATASKVVARDGNGYVFAGYYNSAGTFSTTGVTSGMARFTGTNGTDTYGRSYTAAAAATLLSGSTMDIAGNATTATTLATARTINGVSFDGSANITVADATKLPLTGGTLTGDLNVDTDITAGSTSKTSDTVIRVQAGDANSAGFIANGSAQGTAYFEWSQNSAGDVGGGVVYNGDGSPAFGASEVTDRTTFYRMQFGRIKVFDYPYNSNTVTFYGDTTADGTVTSSTSFRAPIFYDTNNTAYYIDPASTGTAGKFNGTVICKNVDEGVYSNTGTTLNPNLGAIQFKTLTANTTFTDSVDSGESMTLRLDGGATYTVTWPTMTWITSGGNVAPTLNGTKDVIVLWKEGTTLYGAYAGYGA